MAPMSVNVTAGGDVAYPNPFIGPIKDPVAIDIDLAGLTNKEVDSRGYLKPGVPLTKDGALIGALTRSTPDAGTVSTGNGNGAITNVVGGYGAPAENIVVHFTTTGATAAFTVTGSKSGYLGTGAVGTPFSSPVISFDIADGSTDWEALDEITFVVTPAGDNDAVFGVTIELVKVAAGNTSPDLTGVVTAAVSCSGLLNRYLMEDILDRALTAGEVAAFEHSALQITPKAI